MKFITFGLLLFAAQIYCEGTTDMSSSGDGEELTSMVSVTLIDEKGEIFGYTKSAVNNTVTYPFMSGVNAEEVDYDTNLTTIDINATIRTTDTSTSEAPTTTVQTTTEDTTTVTTTTTTETTTMASSTTTTPPTTTMEPTTTTIVTTTTRPTTKTSVKTSTSAPTTKFMKPQLTTRTSRAPLIMTSTYTPDTEKKLCTFEDNNLKCNEEIYCYGEGEIDCSEEASLVSTSPATELSSFASISEDYVDYEASEGAIATFPPNLVGVISPKKIFPSLFKMGSLGTTDRSSYDETNTTVHSTTTSLNTATTSSMLVTNMETTTQVETTMAFDDKTAMSHDSKTADVLNAETTTATDIETSEFILVNDSAKLIDVNETMNTEGFTTEYVSLSNINGTSQNENTTSLLEDNNESNVTIRRKRDESSKSKLSSSSVSSFQAAELKSLKLKMHVKACRITGNLVCKPSPKTSMCTGKTYCKVVVKEAEESAEKATNAETYRDMSATIIVIVAIGGAITIALIIYFITMAYKRGKVQPQNGVTTLNYVNSATLP